MQPFVSATDPIVHDSLPLLQGIADLPRLFSNYFSQQFLYIFMTHITTHFGKEVFSGGLPGHRVTVLIFRLLRHITKVLNVEEKKGSQKPLDKAENTIEQ